MNQIQTTKGEVMPQPHELNNKEYAHRYYNSDYDLGRDFDIKQALDELKRFSAAFIDYKDCAISLINDKDGTQSIYVFFRDANMDTVAVGLITCFYDTDNVRVDLELFFGPVDQSMIDVLPAAHASFLEKHIVKEAA